MKDGGEKEKRLTTAERNRAGQGGFHQDIIEPGVKDGNLSRQIADAEEVVSHVGDCFGLSERVVFVSRTDKGDALCGESTLQNEGSCEEIVGCGDVLLRAVRVG